MDLLGNETYKEVRSDGMVYHMFVKNSIVSDWYQFRVKKDDVGEILLSTFKFIK